MTTYLSPATLKHVGLDDELVVSVDPGRDGGAVAHFTVRSDGSIVQNVLPTFRGRYLPPRARLDVEVWLTKGEMAQRLDDVRAAADREFQLGLLELEVATASYSEHVALTFAMFLLARDDIPASLAVLRGWARNPRRLP